MSRALFDALVQLRQSHSEQLLAAAVAIAVLVGVAVGHRRPALSSGDVEVRLRVYWPQQRGDVDAPVKAILDALQGFVYADDAQVARLVVERGVDADRPRIEIEVESLDCQPLCDPDRARDLRLLLPPKKRGALIAKRLVSSVQRPVNAWDDAHQQQSRPRPRLTAGQDDSGTG